MLSNFPKMKSKYWSWSTLLLNTFLLSMVSPEHTTDATNATDEPPEVVGEVKYLLREEKAAIFAGFIGLLVAVVGFGIYYREMYARQYTDRYKHMNRTGSPKDKYADQSISQWAR